MSDITEILLSVANKRQHKHNGKTLLINGIEYIVYVNYDSFTFSPVCTDEHVHRKYFCVIPFGWQNTDEFRAEYKDIKVIG
jgi:hypothetical protein